MEENQVNNDAQGVSFQFSVLDIDGWLYTARFTPIVLHQFLYFILYQ